MSGRSRAISPRVIPIGSWSPPKPVNDRSVAMTAAGRLRLLTIVFVLVAGCGAAMPASDLEPLKLPDAALEPLNWGSLDGWNADDHAAAFAVFLASCRPLLKGAKPIPETKSMSEALAAVCRRASAAGRLNAEQARKFFERNFRPNHVARLSESLGLLTGYYEPIVDGSRFPTREFTVPIYRRPDDLVMLMPHREGEGFPNRGDVGRRVGDQVVRLISTGPRSRTARSTAAISRFAGSGILSTRCSFRSRARPGSGSRTGSCCGLTTPLTTGFRSRRSAEF